MSHPYQTNTKENRTKIAQKLRDFATAIESETVDIVEHLSFAEYFTDVDRFRGSIQLTLELQSDDVEFGKKIRDFSINKKSESSFFSSR